MKADSPYFREQALWLEVTHSGDARRQTATFTRCVEGGPLHDDNRPAVRTRSAAYDATLGDFRLVYLTDAGDVAFTLPFNAVFAEWITTPEAKEHSRTFSDSLRLPVPKVPMRLTLERRTPTGLVPVVSQVVDPAALEPAAPPLSREVRMLGPSSDAASPASLVFVAEGYAAGEKDRFFEACTKLSQELLTCEPYNSERDRIELRAIFAESDESGISDATKNLKRNTLLGAGYGALGLDRYMLPESDAQLRRMLDGIPCDGLVIVCNADTYGGGGIFGRYAVLPGQASDLRYLLLHEFGHAFGALADEYYGAAVPYDTSCPPCEPWEPNVTALLNGQLKWATTAGAALPIPTPWNKGAYDAAAALPIDSPETRAARRKEQNAILAAEPLRGHVGAFEGAMYRSTGMFRPELECLMFNHSAGGFCRVCRNSIARRLRGFAGAELDPAHE